MSTRVLRIPLRITDLSRDEHGKWRAVVNGQAVSCEWGSWMYKTALQVGGRPVLRDVLPYIAAELQDRVRVLERAERKATRA